MWLFHRDRSILIAAREVLKAEQGQEAKGAI